MEVMANQQFLIPQHIEYLLALEQSSDLDSIGSYLTSHLKMGGGYWSLTSLSLLSIQLSPAQKASIMNWLFTCQNQDGGFGGNTGHDSHITSTHYSLLISIVLDEYQVYMERVGEQVVGYVQHLYNKETGGFWGDNSRLEEDVRFTYCALSLLSIMDQLSTVDTESAASFVLQCQNYDGSFGGLPSMESHGAYVFCAVGSLKILNRLHLVDKQLLSLWLSERQTTAGGFNGRPEKLPDVCYSWWIYASLMMLLANYILECQDEKGGISDKPGNQEDVFHTFFGLAALSLLPTQHQQRLVQIQPVYAIPDRIIRERKELRHLEKSCVQLVKGKNI